MRRLDRDLRRLPGRFMGVLGAEEKCLDDQSQLRRPYGIAEIEGLPGQPRNGGGDGHHEDDRDPREF